MRITKMETQKIRTETTCKKCNETFRVTGRDLVNKTAVKCPKCDNEFIPVSETWAKLADVKK